MKLTTHHKPKFTAELWNFTAESNPDGSPYDEYYKEKDITISIISAEKGTLYVFADEQMRFNTQLRSLRDPAGNLVFKDPLTEESITAYIGVSEPVFNIYGSIIGYRHDLSQEV